MKNIGDFYGLESISFRLKNIFLVIFIIRQDKTMDWKCLIFQSKKMYPTNLIYKQYIGQYMMNMTSNFE